MTKNRSGRSALSERQDIQCKAMGQGRTHNSRLMSDTPLSRTIFVDLRGCGSTSNNSYLTPSTTKSPTIELIMVLL